MQLQTAKLVKGTETRTEDGITGAQHCVIRLTDGVLKKAILKRGPHDHIIAEAFCALLLRGWGLSIPDPFLIDDDGNVAFASAYLDYPNLKQNLGYSPELPPEQQEIIKARAIEILFSLKSTSLAIACDEAIDNRDRNLGNVLWDGTSDAWIDHAFCVGQGCHLPDRNKLCDLAIGTNHEEDATQGGVAHALILDKNLPDDAQLAVEAQATSAGNAEFVASRMESLATRILTRFPAPLDLFNPVEQP